MGILNLFIYLFIYLFFANFKEENIGGGSNFLIAYSSHEQ